MNDEPTREERIAAAEARQEQLHAEGGTVQERLDRLKELKEQILTDEPDTK
jgi:hypothetical protein